MRDVEKFVFETVGKWGVVFIAFARVVYTCLRVELHFEEFSISKNTAQVLRTSSSTPMPCLVYIWFLRALEGRGYVAIGSSLFSGDDVGAETALGLDEHRQFANSKSRTGAGIRYEPHAYGAIPRVCWVLFVDDSHPTCIVELYTF